MKRLTNIEMKSIHGGVMSYDGCTEIEGDENNLDCCIQCGDHRRYCGDVEWYFSHGWNDVC
jgi:hypothetical protein